MDKPFQSVDSARPNLDRKRAQPSAWLIKPRNALSPLWGQRAFNE